MYSTPEISVILPVYNAERTIERCLHTILTQSYKDFEIICINDGSLDKSGDILKKLARTDRRIKIIEKKNQGVSAARNDGIKIAQGKYITFCDADDEVRLNWLENLINGIGKCDYCSSGIHFVKTDGTEYDSVIKIADNSNITDVGLLMEILLKGGIFGNTVCGIYKTEIIRYNKIEFDPTIGQREDQLFCVAYFEHIKSWNVIPSADYIYYLPETGKAYRGVYTDFLFPIFKIYRRIFPEKLPSFLVGIYYRMVRNFIVNQIKTNTIPTKEICSILDYIVKSGCLRRSFSAIVADFFLIQSYRNSVVAKIVINLK